MRERLCNVHTYVQCVRGVCVCVCALFDSTIVKYLSLCVKSKYLPYLCTTMNWHRERRATSKLPYLNHGWHFIPIRRDVPLCVVHLCSLTKYCSRFYSDVPLCVVHLSSVTECCSLSMYKQCIYTWSISLCSCRLTKLPYLKFGWHLIPIWFHVCFMYLFQSTMTLIHMYENLCPALVCIYTSHGPPFSVLAS